MDIKQVERLLEKYGKRLADKPELTEQDIARFRAALAEAREASEAGGKGPRTEPPQEGSRQQLVWPLVSIAGLAVAAVIVLVFVLPFAETPQRPPRLALNVQVETRWPSKTRSFNTDRGPEAPPADDLGAYTIQVSTSKPTFVHLIALLESGDLLVKQLGREHGRPVFSWRVRQEESIGEYPLWCDPEDEPDRGLLLTTHVMVVAAGEPIVQQVTDAVPHRIAAESAQDALRKLEELGQRLEAKLGCVVVVRAIEPSEP